MPSKNKSYKHHKYDISLLCDCDNESYMLAYDWLRSIKPGKTYISSYHLKHVAEYCIGTYIPNSAMIAAGIEHGFNYHTHVGNPNAYFAVDMRSLRVFSDCYFKRPYCCYAHNKRMNNCITVSTL